MALKRYILKTDFKVPYMRVTGNPRKPGKLCGVQYRKGDVIIGELKHQNDKPAFVLVIKDGISLPFPINLVSESVEKEIGASDSVTSSAEGEEKSKLSAALISTNPKVQYLDAMILGAAFGLGAVWFAEKQGWLVSVDKKNKIYGAFAGIAIGAYVVFRIRSSKKPKNKE